MGLEFRRVLLRAEIGKHTANESGHHHHHLICLRCGGIYSFEDDLLDGLEKNIKEKIGFQVTDHEVKLYGYCKECGGNIIEERKNS